MLRTAGHYAAAPEVSDFPMSQVDKAMDHLRAGETNYCIGLDADF